MKDTEHLKGKKKINLQKSKEISQNTRNELNLYPFARQIDLMLHQI